MRHSESTYVNLGYRVEKLKDPEKSRIIMWDIRSKIAQENTPEDKAEALRLVQRGRQEANTGK